jgi:hypothetical protein
LGAGTSSQLNPLGAQGYAYFYTTSTGQPNFTLGQIIDLPAGPFGYSSNVNPYTGGLLQSNSLNSGLSAPQTDELLLGVEHALLPEFVVALNLTYRRSSDILATHRLVFDSPDAYSLTNINQVGRPDRRSDYVECGTPGYGSCPTGTLPNGQPYRADVWFLPTASAAATAGTCTTAAASRSTRALRWSSTSASPTAGCSVAT